MRLFLSILQKDDGIASFNADMSTNRIRRLKKFIFRIKSYEQKPQTQILNHSPYLHNI